MKNIINKILGKNDSDNQTHDKCNCCISALSCPQRSKSKRVDGEYHGNEETITCSDRSHHLLCHSLISLSHFYNYKYNNPELF